MQSVATGCSRRTDMCRGVPARGSAPRRTLTTPPAGRYHLNQSHHGRYAIQPPPARGKVQPLALSVDASPAVPRSIHDVSNGKLLGFGADLGEDHPGFYDEEYKQRRSWIASVAAQHTIGAPIPRITYTPAEVEVWGKALRQLRALFPTHACKEFNHAFARIGFKEEEVPQLQDLSELLYAENGWRIRPVAGLMHPRDFLNGLAFKYFHSTQYVRHHSKPYYTPEPDICHELLGHVPMLVDPEFGSMVQAIGQASLGATEKEIWHLTKVYWFTVEFGVVREGNDLKAFGAGILSSYGELEHMMSGEPVFEPLDPYKAQPKMSYKDGYQKRYFVLDGFEAGAKLLKEYSATLTSSRQ